MPPVEIRRSQPLCDSTLQFIGDPVRGYDDEYMWSTRRATRTALQTRCCLTWGPVQSRRILWIRPGKLRRSTSCPLEIDRSPDML